MLDPCFLSETKLSSEKDTQGEAPAHLQACLERGGSRRLGQPLLHAPRQIVGESALPPGHAPHHGRRHRPDVIKWGLSPFYKLLILLGTAAGGGVDEAAADALDEHLVGHL